MSTAATTSLARAPKRAGRWRRRFVLILLLGLVSFALVEPALWAVGAWLVVEPARPFDPTHLLLLDAERADLVAARMAERDPDLRVLSIEKLPARPMQLGVLPRYEDFVRGQLSAAGVASDRYFVLPRPTSESDDWVAPLAHWLESHPQARVVILTDRLASRYQHDQARRLPRTERDRVRVQPVRRDGVDETNWWRTSAGVIAVIKQYLR